MPDPGDLAHERLLLDSAISTCDGATVQHRRRRGPGDPVPRVGVTDARRERADDQRPEHGIRPPRRGAGERAARPPAFRDLEHAIAAIRTGSVAPHDVGEVRLVPPEGTGGSEPADPRVMPFVVACGTGFDARLIEATSREAKRRYGVAASFLAASRLLGHLEPTPTILTVDGVRRELESMVVLIANCGEAIPGKLRPRLPIDPDDGLLHVFVLPQGGIIGGIRGAIELMTADATGVSASGAGMRLRGTEVRVEVSPAGPTQVDGDVFGHGALEARLLPGRLDVIRDGPWSRAGSASSGTPGERP